MSSASDLLQQAFAAHRVGDLGKAELLYRQVLQADPDNADAWNLLGATCVQQGKRPEAIGYLRNAVRLRPDLASIHENLGVALAHDSQYDEAAHCFRKAVSLAPGRPETQGQLGHALVQVGQLRQAEAIAGRLSPAVPAARTKTEADTAAVDAFRGALRLRPEDPKILDALGWTLLGLGKHPEAIEAFQQALRLQPNYARARSDLGEAYRQLGRLEEAVACFREAIRLAPEVGETHNRLGATLVMQDRLEEAIPVLREALQRDADNPSILQNLASAAFESGRVLEARDLLRRSVALAPTYAAGHMALGQALLMLGEYAEGWREYEWRWHTREYAPRPFRQPRWRGEAVAGKTVLLYAEQGHGDTLQFVRYAPLLKERGARVVVECQPALLSLLRNAPGIDQLMPLGAPLPPFDMHAPLLSLPGAFGTTLATLPANVPYLHADPQRVQAWRQRLQESPGFQVGIIWQGNPKFSGDRKRSIPLPFYEPLSRIPGVRLVSLQRGTGANALDTLHGAFPVRDLGRAQNDDSFADMAALMQAVDLVITSDTGPAHLAGSLGVPVWVALHTACDWRWLLEREDCPWYPTMRLFRQHRDGAWEEVFVRLAKALSDRVSQLQAPGTH